MTRFLEHTLLLLVVTTATLVCLGNRPCDAARPTNMDFESGTGADGFPSGWDDPTVLPTTGGKGYEVALDSSIVHAGRASARIRYVGPEKSTLGYGTITQGFSPEGYLGKRVRLSGYVRTLGVTGVGAQVWIRVDGAYGALADDSMEDRSITGTTDWKRYECVLDVSAKATMIVIGAALEGEGTMWVDDMVVEEVSEDVPTTAGPMMVDREPRPEAVEWLRVNGHPIETPEAGNGFEDLAPFADMVGDARVVGLGEGTHGTREFFQMKHRLLEFLAKKKGFTIFAIEASTPEAYRLNDYVMGGEGDPRELIRGMYFWTWSTEEMLSMVEWMREFNVSGEGRLQYTGFDMQTPDVAKTVVLDFLQRVDAALEPVAREKYARIAPPGHSRAQSFGVATWRFPVEDARGKQARFSGYIKTQDLRDGWAGLWWRVDSEKRRAIAFDNMNSRGPRGTTGWKRYEVVLDVVEDAANISFGVLMPGSGRAWFDSLAVELDGVPYSPPETFDFDFETSTDGYHTSNGSAYRVVLTTDEAKSGAKSLLMEKLDEPVAEEPTLQSVAEMAGEVYESMKEARARYLESAGARDVDWAIHNARIVQQATRLRADPKSSFRDESMAENVAWILDQNPGAKVVLWAHNGHIQRAEGRLGRYLAEKYGDDYVPVGFATHEGRYVAWGEKALTTSDLIPSPSGSVESFFAATESPAMFVDLRRGAADPAAAWLAEPRAFRQIGAVATDYQFFPEVIADRFDVLVYFRETTPAVQLKDAE